MNEEAMIETLARVEREQALLRQGNHRALGFSMHMWYSTAGNDEFGNVCGTTACLAGHAALAHGWEATNGETCRNSLTGLYWDYECAGKRVLGITDIEAENLFYLDSLADVYRWVAHKMGVEEQVLRDKVTGYVFTEQT